MGLTHTPKQQEPWKTKNENELNYKNKQLISLPLLKRETKNLEIVNLSRNKLKSGAFLKFKLTDFSSLTVLNLSQNKIEKLYFFKNLKLPSLTTLDLSNNKLSSFDEIVHLETLTMLNLANNCINRIPEKIKNLIKLKSFDASNNQLTSIDEIIHLKNNLRELNVFKNDDLHKIPIELRTEKIYLDSDLPDEIIPGLFLGSIDSASNTNLMKKLKIEHILSVCGDIPENILNQIQNNFDSKLIKVDDNGIDDLEFENCFDFINESLEKNNVLVHCWQGISRSSSVVCYYLMKKQKISFDQSFTIVHSKRPIVKPNYGFAQRLKELENT
eukprot:gene3631-6447_t